MKAFTLTAAVLGLLASSALAGATHQIVSGDTVHSIARRHSVSVQDLLKWNGISDPTKLRIGDTLKLSQKKVSKKTSTSRTAKGSYTIKGGDTLYSIARKNGLSVKQLKRLNPGIDPSRLSVGQTLVLKGKAAPAPTPKSKKPAVKIQKVAKKPKAEPQIKISQPAPQESSTREVQKAPETPEKPLAESTPTPSEQITETPPTREQTVIEEKVASSTPPSPPVVNVTPPAPTKVAAIILTDETTFGDFASKHKTTPAQLNALNGWNLPQATVLARGSEIYVPQ